MSAIKTLEITSTKVEETLYFGVKIGKNLKGGEVIELSSDLGGGKTTLTRGILSGLGSNDHVSSPTFKICNNYSTSKGISVFHYDFYRISDPGLIQHEISEVLDDEKAIIIVEWAKIINNVLPEDKIEIDIINLGENSRKITLMFSDKFNYLKRIKV
jgi:tRNA threonylcarbamoyladenosine biosynthesis protein TsaE